MKKPIKNHAKSVRTKLLDLKKTSGCEYMYLLARYFNERLLYRVSVSQYKNNFLLKGGSLLYAMDGLDTRPTVDVDFMADKISRDRSHLEEVFREILSIPCEEDGVIFDIGNLRSESITVEKEYPGIRFFVTAHMDTIEHNIYLDIGFGDVVTPYPAFIDFPLLLQDIPSINIQAYSIETVIAEKFHTMIDRDVTNSRMKDFFDCYQILTTKEIDKSVLRDAIIATFENRELRYNPNLQLFTDSFVTDGVRQKRWQTFLKKIRWKVEIPFADVMKCINEQLKDIMDEYWKSLLREIAEP